MSCLTPPHPAPGLTDQGLPAPLNGQPASQQTGPVQPQRQSGCAGGSCQPVAGPGRTKGQGLLETLLALPLLVFFIGGLMQLLWLLLAQQMLQAATLYMAREVSHDDYSLLGLQAVFWERMLPLPGRSYALPDIRLVQPSQHTARQYGVYDEERKAYRIDRAFLLQRLAALEAEPEELEEALASLVVTLEVNWCFPMRVPVVNRVLQEILYPNRYWSSRWCLASGHAGPEIRLRSRATMPIRGAVTVAGSG